MKENFDFGNPKDDSLGPWPKEEQLPGFRKFAGEFHQVQGILATSGEMAHEY